MKIEHGKSYISKDGHIIEIVQDRDAFFATQRTSPGKLEGFNVIEYSKEMRMDWAKKYGWKYKDNGEVYYRSHSDLDIVSEYPHELSDPPEGYKWAGGFPQLQIPTIDGHFLSVGGYVYTGNSLDFWINEPIIGQRRIALEIAAASPPETIVAKPPEWPKYYINNNVPRNWGIVKYNEKSAHFFKASGRDTGGPFDWISDHDSSISRGVWKEVTKEEMVARFDKNPLSKAEEEVVATPPQEQYYIYASRNCDTIKRYFVKRGNEWFNYNTNKDQEFLDGSPESFWQGYIRDGHIKPCTKEEALAKISKKSPPQEQYYIAPKEIPWFDKSVKYVVQKDNEWRMRIYTGYRHKEEVDKSGADWWQKKVQEGCLIPCSKEEALAKIGDMPPKTVTTASTLTIAGSPVVAQKKEVAVPLIERDLVGIVQKFPISKEEKDMSKSTVVSFVSSAFSHAVGAANYLYVEPTKIIGGYVKRSLRYFVLAGTVSAVVYGVNDPTALKKRVASFVPKITIEAPSALK